MLGALLSSDAHRGAYDFQAFYCAGHALREHADPYRAQPLGACEHRLTDGTYAALPPGVALPAPQPPYDIVLFSLLAMLPFLAAKAVWGAILGVAIAIAIAGLARVTRAPPGVVFIALAASLILPALAFGQIIAVFAAACCTAAFFAQRGNWRMAGLAASISLIEPHLGLPVCLALALWNRSARAAVIAGALVLAAVSLFAAGWRESIEYVATVLPLHARSELGSDAQLSLSAVLHALGLSDAQALRWGTISSVASTVLGVRLARTLAVRLRDDAFLVAVPLAFSVIGGTFIHATEMFAAIPLALLFVMRVRHCRPLSLTALVLLSVPWFTVLEGGTPFAFPAVAAIVIFYLVWRMREGRVPVAVALAACAWFALTCAPQVNAIAVHHFGSARALGALSAVYPQAGWQALNERTLSSGTAMTWILRAASWAGLLAIAAAAAVYSLTSIDVRSNSA